MLGGVKSSPLPREREAGTRATDGLIESVESEAAFGARLSRRALRLLKWLTWLRLLAIEARLTLRRLELLRLGRLTLRRLAVEARLSLRRLELRLGLLILRLGRGESAGRRDGDQLARHGVHVIFRDSRQGGLRRRRLDGASISVDIDGSIGLRRP